MFDPKKAGEEADTLITSLNQPPKVEDQAGTDDAIAVEDIDTTEAVAAAASPPAAPEPAPDVPALSELKRQLDAAEQRWKVLQGMIDKKDDELEQMRILFAQMGNATAAAEPTAPAAELITAQDRTDFGDIPVLVQRMATQIATTIATKIVSDELAKFKPTMDKLEVGVATANKQVGDTAYEQFTARLADKVEDWETLNTNPGFLAWLDKIDEFAGVSRLTLIRDAFSHLNVGRVAKFFSAYKDEAGIGAPAAAAAEPAPPPADVRKFVAPGKSKATPGKVDNGANTKQWSRADISKLYDDKMKGRISQTQFEEQERDLFKAQHEGRVAA